MVTCDHRTGSAPDVPTLCADFVADAVASGSPEEMAAALAALRRTLDPIIGSGTGAADLSAMAELVRTARVPAQAGRFAAH